MSVTRTIAAARPRTASRLRLLPWAPTLTLAILLVPILAGVAGTLAPALGWLPALGRDAINLAAWRDLLAWPGLNRCAALSVTTGLLATAISLGITVLVCAAWQGTRLFVAVERLLSPLLSVPHAAAAFGLAFLIAPSGWIVRALSPWATAWTAPPDVLIVQDPHGFAMVSGLVVKEVPFLLLMTLAALGQTDAGRSRLTAETLGYGRVTAWVKTVFPRVYPQIRLPVYAVLAYSMSVVDVALILGPTRPPTLAVQILHWINDPDLALRFRASAGAVLQLMLVLGTLGLWRLGELIGAHLGRLWGEAGGRGTRDGAIRALALGGAGLSASAVFLGLIGLAVWSVAGLWTFPDVLPQAFSGRAWAYASSELGALSAETARIGGVATLVALVLTLACLEAEHRVGVQPTIRTLEDRRLDSLRQVSVRRVSVVGRDRRARPARRLWLLYLPLLIPQIVFLLGLQTLATAVGMNGGQVSVIAVHVIFVVPYVFLSLADPFRAWDPRMGLAAATLGAGPDRVFWAVRLPMLLRPVLTAAAVGFAVSVGQYLPTVLIGAGRVSTLTTEAVSLASGGDRRLIGVYALTQATAAFVGFVAALAIPALVFRNRRALRLHA